MANLMSGVLTTIIKEQVETQISKGNTALATAYKEKKFNDCVQAILQAFMKMCNQKNTAMNGEDALIGSAAIHWYTEENATVESIIDILKGGTEILPLEQVIAKKVVDAINKLRAQDSKPKESKPKPQPKPKTPTLPPMQVVKTPTLPPAEEEEDEDWFD